MSLDFDLRKIPLETRTVIATYDDRMDGVTKGDRIMSPVTKSLIFSTMSIGIGEITDKTVDEFVARLDLFQKIHGALMHAFDHDAQEWVERPLTRADVVAHKGLSTNVFPMETRGKWVARMVTKSRDLFPHAEPKG